MSTNNDITIDLEEIERMPKHSIRDAETIRQLSLQAIRIGDNSLLDRVDPELSFAGLYPEVVTKLDAAPTHNEFERRFLLKRLPRDIRIKEHMSIRQFYGAEGRFRETIKWELRGSHPEDGYKPQSTTYVKEVKTVVGHGHNLETDPTPMTHKQFLKATEGCTRMIDKTRYIYLDSYGREWEIDEFKSSLVIAEIEAPSEDDLKSISFPKDLEPWLIKEITGDKSFSNYNLSDEIDQNSIRF